MSQKLIKAKQAAQKGDWRVAIACLRDVLSTPRLRDCEDASSLRFYVRNEQWTLALRCLRTILAELRVRKQQYLGSVPEVRRFLAACLTSNAVSVTNQIVAKHCSQDRTRAGHSRFLWEEDINLLLQSKFELEEASLLDPTGTNVRTRLSEFNEHILQLGVDLESHRRKRFPTFGNKVQDNFRQCLQEFLGLCFKISKGLASFVVGVVILWLMFLASFLIALG